jgi:outer membrane protein W
MKDAESHQVIYELKKQELDMKIYAVLLCGLMATTSVYAEYSGESRSAMEVNPASRHLDSRQAGVKIGVAQVEQLGDPAVTYGVYGNVAMSDNVLGGVSLDYWSKSNGTISSTPVDASDLTASLDLKYIFTDVARAVRPYVFGGAAAHRFVVRETSEDTNPSSNRLEPKYRDLVGKFGLDYGAGIMYRFGKSTDAVGEMRYRNIMDPAISLSQLVFTGGLNFMM